MKLAGIVQGVGINDSKTPVTKWDNTLKKTAWICPYYKTWAAMINRCYSKSYLKRKPTYLGCSVCQEWLLFSNFKAWMGAQDWEDKHLDKDLLVMGNKIYSPETCAFVSVDVNNALVDCEKARGAYPKGVHFCKKAKRFIASVRAGRGIKLNLGVFDSAEEAHQVYLAAKLDYIKELAIKQSDPRVAEALVERFSSYLT